jgi:hypothetical protein
MCTKFWLESLKGRDHSEDLSVDGRIILKLILREKGECELDSSGQGRLQLLMNTVMNLLVP